MRGPLIVPGHAASERVLVTASAAPAPPHSNGVNVIDLNALLQAARRWGTDYRHWLCATSRLTGGTLRM